MNIVTLFPCRHTDELLINLEAEHSGPGWTSERAFSEVSGLSAGLKHRGIQKNDKVLILSSNCAESYLLMLAVMNVGAVAVPVNPLLGMAALADIIHEVSPVCSVTDRSPDSQLGQLLEANCRFNVQLKHCDNPSEWQSNYQSLLLAGERCEPGDFAGSQQAMLIHSSGSQGLPKVISLSHQNLFNYFHYHDVVHQQFAEVPGRGALLKPLINVFQPSHLAAFSMVMQAFLLRRPVCLMRAFDSSAFLQHMSRLACHMSVLVPSMYAALLREADFIGEKLLPHWKLGAAVGEPASFTMMRSMEDQFGIKMFAGYGLTECLPGIAHTWSDLHVGDAVPGSCGKHLFGEVKLVSTNSQDSGPENGAESIQNSTGELWLRNTSVHRCYLNDALNDEKMTADGWLRTGDLFHRDAAGNFFHKGRIDEMFVCNGKNVYPAEIESVLQKHPMIRGVIASALENQHGKIMPAVLLECKSEVSAAEVIDFFVERGPSHAIPGFVSFTKLLPKLGPGKLDRRQCQQQLRLSYQQQNLSAIA